MGRKKIIDLNSNPGKDLGEEITCTDENIDESCITYDEDKGEEFNLFQEDDEIILDGKRIKRNESSDVTVQKIFEVKDTPIKTSNINKIETATDKTDPAPVKTNGITTPVNGEAFSIKRGYQFRPSTIKKLNELKANSDNINIYFNEIIDAAICYYYDAVIK